MQSCNGVRKKHIPQRTCIGCRETKDKAELLRISVGEDGAIRPDEGKGASGRGAYICKNPVCLEKAIKTKGLDRAFKTSFNKENYEKLREYLSARAENN